MKSFASVCSGKSTLIATRCRSRWWNASYTAPMPPSAIFRTMRYLSTSTSPGSGSLALSAPGMTQFTTRSFERDPEGRADLIGAESALLGGLVDHEGGGHDAADHHDPDHGPEVPPLEDRLLSLERDVERSPLVL